MNQYSCRAISPNSTQSVIQIQSPVPLRDARYTRMFMAAVYAIVPAAGLGTRMQASFGGEAKQFLLLDGKPILLHTLETLASIAGLAGIAVAVRESERERAQTLLAE